MLVDLTRCNGCDSCALPCKEFNQRPDPTVVPIELSSDAYTFVDRRDGEDIEHAGRILELDRPGRLAFEFSVPKYDPRMTTVRLDIMADGTGSLLTLTHEGVDDAYLEQTGKGWTMILETAAASLE